MSQSERDADAISVTFDSKVYSLTAVKKAAYRYLDRFSADISIVDSKINCRLIATSAKDQASRERLIEDFRKEVLDQDLRESLKTETEAVRNLILSYAFSQTAIPSDENIS
jgi:His-Xaa-Ser system protein HxsD